MRCMITEYSIGNKIVPAQVAKDKLKVDPTQTTNLLRCKAKRPAKGFQGCKFVGFGGRRFSNKSLQ